MENMNSQKFIINDNNLCKMWCRMKNAVELNDFKHTIIYFACLYSWLIKSFCATFIF